jgi:hypothetical protein
MLLIEPITHKFLMKKRGKVKLNEQQEKGVAKIALRRYSYRFYLHCRKASFKGF